MATAGCEGGVVSQFPRKRVSVAATWTADGRSSRAWASEWCRARGKIKTPRTRVDGGRIDLPRFLSYPCVGQRSIHGVVGGEGGAFDGARDRGARTRGGRLRFPRSRRHGSFANKARPKTRRRTERSRPSASRTVSPALVIAFQAFEGRELGGGESAHEGGKRGVLCPPCKRNGGRRSDASSS